MAHPDHATIRRLTGSAGHAAELAQIHREGLGRLLRLGLMQWSHDENHWHTGKPPSSAIVIRIWRGTYWDYRYRRRTVASLPIRPA